MAYEKLNEVICNDLTKLFDHFNLKTYHYGRYYALACPVHCGNNATACNIYPQGYKLPGYWVCNTHHCETTFYKTTIGFVRGILSNRKFGWTKRGDKVFDFAETIKYIEQLYGVSHRELGDEDCIASEKKIFTQNVEIINHEKSGNAIWIPRSEIERSLEIPAKAFLSRNFSEATLRKFSIGLCRNPAKPFYNRVVVPVFNEKATHAVGCLGRTIFGLCNKCNLYHVGQKEDCPAEYHVQYSKWRNQKGFTTGEHLYNYWNAANAIKKSKVVILTESVGNVLRLEECGIHNAVALFTNKLSETQQLRLEMSGALAVIPIMDNDEGGHTGLQLIKDKLGRIFDIAHIFPPAEVNDLADMNNEQVKELILPHVNKMVSTYNFSF